MKKIIFLIFILFGFNNLFSKEYKQPSPFVLSTFLGVFEDIEKITDSEQEKTSKKTFILLREIFSLSLNMLNKDYLTRDLYKDTLSELIINFFDLLDIDKKDNSYLFNNSGYISLLKKYTPEKRVNLIKEILSSVDQKVVESFIKEVFGAIADYLNKRLDDIIHEVKIKLKIYFNLKGINNIEERNKKTDQILAAVFGTLANVCVQSSQVVGTQNPNEKEQGVLNLLGNAFNLAGQITYITSHHSKIIENDKNINLLLVNLILELYNQKYYYGISNSWKLELDLLKTNEQKINWFVEKIASDSFAKKLIKELVACLRTLLHDQIDDIVEYLSDKLLEYFFPQENSDENDKKLPEKSFL